MEELRPPPLAEPLGEGTLAPLLGLHPTIEALTAQAAVTLSMLFFATWSFVIGPRRAERKAGTETA